MYYDCFTFHRELELLKIRCEELKSLDVVHVLVEATMTHTGLEKPLYYLEHRNEFAEYNIKHIIVDDLINDGDPWHSENHQRDCIMRGLTDMSDSDVVGIFDLDEIPRKEIIPYYEKRMGVAAPVMDKYSVFLNLLEGYQNWNVGRLTTWGLLKQTTPNELRNMGPNFMINYGGWHMSFIGGIDRIKDKIISYAHTETNNANFWDTLEYKYATGQSFWGSDYWVFVPIDDTFPQYLIKNQSEFDSYIRKV